MGLAIALVCNKKQKNSEMPPDFYAECDSETTIAAIETALKKTASEVIVIEADMNVYEKLKKAKIDIAYNVAEGLYGESRESQIPAMLEMLRIPYTGSGILTLALSLNKAKTKEVLIANSIPTPKFQVFSSSKTKLKAGLKFPLIVKPIAEGSSKGIMNNAVVKSEKELYERVDCIIKTYHQDALVEQFLQGKEFTVAVIGNDNPLCLPIVEINLHELPRQSNRIYCFEAKYQWDTPEKPLKIFTCPANIHKELEQEIKSAVLKAYSATGCRDWARIDVRLDENNIPNILEINPLPGMLPKIEDNSCLPAAARASGFSYEEAVNLPLLFALERNSLGEHIKNQYFKKLMQKIELLKK